MRIRGARVEEILLGLALVAGLLWNVAKASEISGLQLSTGPTGTRAELKLDGTAEFKVISLANPDRLVIDLPGGRLASGFKLPSPAGLVSGVRSGQPEPGVTRIVFDLASAVVAMGPRLEPAADGARLVVEWPDDPAAAPRPVAGGAHDPIAALLASVAPQEPAAPAADPVEASNAATNRLVAQIAAGGARTAEGADAHAGGLVPAAAQPAQSAQSAQAHSSVAREAAPAPVPVQPADVMRPLVIAIDAGHGGQDPGAVGPSGTREKDVTLAIARELARQVDATPGLKAYLTRDSDVFIPLHHRTRLAREAGADMFISVHADAAHNRNAKGSSVYVLSLRGASSQRARWLADKENAADLIGGVRLQETDDTLASVLLDLTQSGQMKASEDAGQHILEGLKRIGNNHKPHIERANFAVLRTSDMPAMLVETAFLSNPEEEKRLIDPQFQRTVARAVLDGVNTYFSNQPPPGTLFAARAMAERQGGQRGEVSGGSP